MNQLLGLNEKDLDFPLNLTVIDESDPKRKNDPLDEKRKIDPLDDKFVVVNCLTCHSGIRANRAIIGAANHNLNPVGFSDFLKSFKLTARSIKETTAGFTPHEREEAQKQAKFFDKFLMPSLDSERVPSKSRGVNYGPFFDGLMLTQREKTNPTYPFQVNYEKLTPAYIAAIAFGPLPTQPHPWYVPGDDPYRFAEDFSSKGKRPLPHFTNFRVPTNLSKIPTPKEIERAKAEAKGLIQSTNEIWKLFSCLDAPLYPGKVDLEKANRGCELYNKKTCVECHGTIKNQNGTWTVGEYSKSIRNVGTDPIYRQSVKSGVEAFKKSLPDDWEKKTTALMNEIDPSRTYTNEIQSVGTFEGSPKGYQPRPLTALWTRAPYGHNAIFPTVESMITPENERPAFYKMGPPTSFDFDKMGMVWEPLNKEKFDSYVEEARKGNFDPTLLVSTLEKGRSNKGHSGLLQTISDLEERKALLECFKVLVPR